MQRWFTVQFTPWHFLWVGELLTEPSVYTNQYQHILIAVVRIYLLLKPLTHMIVITA